MQQVSVVPYWHLGVAFDATLQGAIMAAVGILISLATLACTMATFTKNSRFLTVYRIENLNSAWYLAHTMVAHSRVARFKSRFC